MYRVLITASGTGSRLKDLTKDKNKALVTINGKAVVDYILEKYSPDIEVVITLGYKREQVKKYVSEKYPERNITFVEIDTFEGPGSSLGYSMLQTKELLQCPFIFHCNDTIVLDSLPSPEYYNWNGGAKGNDKLLFNSKYYSSFTVKKGQMSKIQPKGAVYGDYLHVGLVGIKDYIEFWEELENEYKKNPQDSGLNDVSAINHMLEKDIVFETVVCKDWFDTGNLQSLDIAKREL